MTKKNDYYTYKTLFLESIWISKTFFVDLSEIGHKVIEISYLSTNNIAKMINTTENLILIDNQIQTPQIESCQYNSTQKKYDIIFQGNPKVSSYDVHRVLWLKHPIQLDPRIYQVTHKGRKLSNIDSISVFNK